MVNRYGSTLLTGLLTAATINLAVLARGDVAANPAMPPQVSLQHLGMIALPTGTMADGIRIEELSGISYDRDADIFLAVNDSSGVGQARIYRFLLDYDADGFYSVDALGADPLRYGDGSLLPSVDAEGLALGQNRNLYVSHEGRGVASPPDTRDPWVWEFDADTLQRTQAPTTPEHFLPRDAEGNPVAPGNANQRTGVQRNLGFEALTLCPAERSLYTTTEAALLQDDSRAAFDGQWNQAHQSDSRILRYQRDGDGLWQPGAEKVYRSDQGHWFFIRIFNTVPSILAIDERGRMLVMERGLTAANLDTGSYRIRIYEVDFNQPGATDVSPYPSLLDIPSPLIFNRLSKRLVWQSSSGMDNIEGMTWGRDINGYRSLVLVSDNNNSSAQETQFHVLLSNIPAPVRLETENQGPGTVDVGPPIAEHLPGSTVTLHPVADPGFAFVRWSGHVDGNDVPLTLSMEAAEPVTLTAVFGSHYEAWLHRFYTPAEIAQSALGDPLLGLFAGDAPGLLKYALGLPPDQPAPGSLARLTADPVNPDYPMLEYHRPEPQPAGVQYVFESSLNLSQWHTYWVHEYPHVYLTETTPGQMRVRLRSPWSVHEHPQQFLRLKISLDDPDAP